MVENGWKLLKWLKITENGWKQLKKVVNGWKRLKTTETTKCGWKRLKMDENGWDSKYWMILKKNVKVVTLVLKLKQRCSKLGVSLLVELHWEGLVINTIPCLVSWRTIQGIISSWQVVISKSMPQNIIHKRIRTFSLEAKLTNHC